MTSRCRMLAGLGRLALAGIAMGLWGGSRLAAAASGDTVWFSQLFDTAYYGVTSDGKRVYTAGRELNPVNGTFDVVIDAYDPASGANLWHSVFDGGDDESAGLWRTVNDNFAPKLENALVRVQGGHVVIGGVAFPPTQHPDALVRVYDAATGAFEWGDRLVSFVPGNPQNEGPGGEFGTLALEVGKGRVFIATGGVARAYDLKTGAQLWEFSFSDPVYDLHVFPQRNLPKALRLLGNRLFVGVTRHGTPKGFPPELGLPPATFRVQALDARTGALLWTSDGPVAWDDNCTFPGPRALATGWGLVFAVGMGQLGPPPVDDFCGEIPDFKIRALDQVTGNVVWEDPPAGPGNVTLGRGMAVTVGDHRVFTAGYTVPSGDYQDATNFLVRAYDAATGIQVWQDELQFGQYSAAYAAIFINKSVFIPLPVGAGARAPRKLDFEALRSFLVVAGYGSTALGDGVALLRAYDPANGQLIWERELGTANKLDQYLALTLAKGQIVAVGPSTREDNPKDFAGDDQFQDGLIASYRR